MRITPINNQVFTAKTFYTFDSEYEYKRTLQELTDQTLRPDTNAKGEPCTYGLIYPLGNGILYLTEGDRDTFQAKVKNGDDTQALINVYIKDPGTKKVHINDSKINERRK